MNIVIFDFEVFKYDVLLGAIVIQGNNKTLFQSWNTDEIKQFYFTNENSIWVGHNNNKYDNLILETIINGGNPKKVNDNIIKHNKRFKFTIPKYSYDLLFHAQKPYSLKLSELLIGKKISETNVDFDIDRPLTEDEKQLTEEYNRDDLSQTLYNFNACYDSFLMRIHMCKEFNLPLSTLSNTGTQVGAMVLNSIRNDELKNMPIYPKLYENLLLENKDLKQFYLNEDFKTPKKINIQIGNADIKIGAGGAHSAENQYHSDKVFYFDVSGYYNLVMMNYDLLPRTMDEASKELYNSMYHEQLRLKKINPARRAVLKVILLCVFGATTNEFTDFYDPYKGPLITMTGQLFICDLLEKLKEYVTIVQTNTDGIIVEPKDWKDKDKIIEIVEDWEKRTGFVIKKEIKYNLWQRDVNCYFCIGEDNSVEFHGNTVKNYDTSVKAFAKGDLFDNSEPPIIAQGIVNYLVFKKYPEQFVEENKTNLILFQYACKKVSYDYSTYDLTDLETNDTISTRLQGINRAFAMKDKTKIGIIRKHKFDGDKIKSAKIANLPNSVFVYDDEILSNDTKEKLIPLIDYQYYIDRIYYKLREFVKIKEIKDILI